MKTSTKLLILCLFTLLVSCSAKKATPGEEAEIKDVISRNIIAYDKIDLHTIKATSVGMERSLEQKAAIASMNEYTSSLESMEITKFTGQKAEVSVVIYKESHDSLGTDMRATAIRHLVKKKDGWKISKAQEIDEVPITE